MKRVFLLLFVCIFVHVSDDGEPKPGAKMKRLFLTQIRARIRTGKDAYSAEPSLQLNLPLWAASRPGAVRYGPACPACPACFRLSCGDSTERRHSQFSFTLIITRHHRD